MAITHSEVRRLSSILLVLILIILSFIVVRPIFMSIVAGMLLAYAFLPIHRQVLKYLKEKNSATLVVSIFLILIIFIPLWFLTPLAVQQTFDMFNAVQALDIRGFIDRILPGAPIEFQEETAAVVITFIGKVTSAAIDSLTGLLIDLPNIMLQLAIVAFVFFFTLRDHEKLKRYVSELSPVRKDKQKMLIKQFKDVTSSVVFGFVVIGIIQGVATGIGMFIFGVPRPIILTILSIVTGILPLFGSWLVWIPAAIYLFGTGSLGAAIGLTLYCALFVSSIDNVLRPYFVSRKTGVSPVVALVGMIGGLLVFGILGFLIGPLILAYLLLFLAAYKNRTLAELFSSE